MKGFKQKDLLSTQKNLKNLNFQKNTQNQLKKASPKKIRSQFSNQILKICKTSSSFLIFEKLQKILNNIKNPKSLINEKDENGKTSLMYCVEKNDLESVKLLLEYGGDVNIRDCNKENIFFYILKCENFDFDIFEELLKKNDFLDFVNKFGESVFLKSLKFFNFEIVNFLWKFNIDFFKRDIFGFNSIDLIFILQNQILLQKLKMKFSDEIFNSFFSYYTEKKIIFLKNNLEKTKNEFKKKNIDKKKKKLKLNPKSSNFSPKLKNQKKSKLSEKKQKIENSKKQINNIITKLKILEKANLDLAKKIKQKKNSITNKSFKKSKNFCFFKKTEKKKKNSSQSKKKEYTIVYKKITKKINTYIKCLENYQKITNPIFKQIEKLIKKKIKNNFENLKNLENEILIETSGSYSIDLLMPWSDLNIIVSFNQKFYDINKENLYHKKIKNFAKKLKNSKFIKNLKYEERSNLDIIKIEMSKEFCNKKVEIIFKHFINNNYPSNEKIMKNFIKKYPISKPLYIILRKILHKQKLDDPSKYGLRTICIYFLIIGFLQNLNYPVFTKIESNKKIVDGFENIGEIFINFIYFYSYNFDFYNQMINPFLENSEKKKSIFFKNFHKKIKSLTILNPYKSSIILTKSFRRTQELKSLFKFIYISFFQFCSCSNQNRFKIVENQNVNYYPLLNKNNNESFLGQKKISILSKNFLNEKKEDFLNENFDNKKRESFLTKNFENKKENFLTKNFENKKKEKFSEKKNNSFINKKNDIEEKDTTTPESFLFKFQRIIIKYKNMISKQKKIKFLKFSHEVEFFSNEKNNLFSDEENFLSEFSDEEKKCYDSEFSLNRLFNFNLCKPLIYN